MLDAAIVPAGDAAFSVGAGADDSRTDDCGPDRFGFSGSSCGFDLRGPVSVSRLSFGESVYVNAASFRTLYVRYHTSVPATGDMKLFVGSAPPTPAATPSTTTTFVVFPTARHKNVTHE